MNDLSAPTIYVLAGLNGAGKTSLYLYEALAMPRGHDVPPALIQPRYTNGLSLPKQHYRVFDRVQLYDNTGTKARQVAEIRPSYPPQPSVWLTT